MKKILVVCTTDSMIWNFLVPHIKMLEEKGYYVECASSVTGDFYENLQKIHGIKMNLIRFERSPYRFANVKAYKELCELIRNKKFDVIFCHEPVGGAMGRLAGYKCGCRVVYMAHGFHFFKGAPKTRIIYYWIERFLSSFTDVLITINHEDYVVSLTFNAKKCVKINGIGIDTDKFVPNEEEDCLDREFNLPKGAIKVLSVGELIERKNHEVIIKSIAKIKNPALFYFIAGEGECREKLETLIKELKIEENVFLLGYRTDIGSLCNSADVFAMPSVHEGLSVALMEAMGCGRAVVCSNIRGNIDLIENEKGGYICSVFDEEEYVDAIEKLISSPQNREKFGQYNIKRIKDFDINVVKNQMMEIWDKF